MHRNVSNVLISTFANLAKLSPMSSIPITASSRFSSSMTSSTASLARTSSSTALCATPLAAARLFTEFATSACTLLARTLIFVRIARLCPSQSIRLIIPCSRSRLPRRLFLKSFVRGKRLGSGQSPSSRPCLSSATSHCHRSPSCSPCQSTPVQSECLSCRRVCLCLHLCPFASTRPLRLSKLPVSRFPRKRLESATASHLFRPPTMEKRRAYRLRHLPQFLRHTTFVSPRPSLSCCLQSRLLSPLLPSLPLFRCTSLRGQNPSAWGGTTSVARRGQNPLA